MKLSRMHNIGGCRAVLASVAKVDQLVGIYRKGAAKNPNDRSELIRIYNYITDPKEDGYRSVHLVYKYRSAAPERERYNNLRIEVQIRSKLQHAWATAVETVATFTGQALKSNTSEGDWRRFFALMGHAMAIRERRPWVPGMPSDYKEVKTELRDLAGTLNVIDRLAGWSAAIRRATATARGADCFLLVLDLEQKMLRVTPYRADQWTQATTDYSRIEELAEEKPQVQAVLVAVDSISALQKAYPNYYADTSAFVEALHLEVS
jgi:hypothetical protein